MGFRTDVRALASLAESFAHAPTDVGIRSPFAGDLSRIVVPDLLSLFGIDDWSCFGREQAMSLPGVFRARAIILSLLADKPMNAWRKDELVPIAEQPSFLHRTPGIMGPWHRMAFTLDDLMFYGMSLWATKRGLPKGDDGRKDVLSAVRVPFERWKINEFDLIEIQNADGGWDVADEDQVILIPGPSAGVIEYAVRTLRGAAAIDDAWVTRARNPSPITELHLTEDIPLTDTEVTETRDAWANARRSATGAVAVTPSNIEVIDHGGDADAQLYVEGRNAARLDIAAFFNLPGSILDASTATASLTYVTEQNTRASVYDLSLPYWFRPIEARLSQDDIVPQGQSVRFDFSSLTAQPSIATED